MSVNKTAIALKHFRAIVADDTVILRAGIAPKNTAAFVAVVAEGLLRYGFLPTEKLIQALESMDLGVLEQVYKEVLPELARAKGADVVHRPMYPNFPVQVMEASAAELFMNAIVHYISWGTWLPEFEEKPRGFALDAALKPLDVVSESQFKGLFATLLSTRESLSDFDKGAIAWFMDNYADALATSEHIPFKENMAVVAGLAVERGRYDVLTALPGTATDVLRIATFLSGGDVSLAKASKFKSFSRALRRALCTALERVANVDDLLRHKNKWVCLFHGLHVGEHSDKLFQLAQFVRGDRKVLSYGGRIQEAIDNKEWNDAVLLLRRRPGEFARRLDYLMRTAPSTVTPTIASQFLEVSDQVETRVLLQLMGRLNRSAARDKRVIFPKGMTQKAILLRGFLPSWQGVDPVEVRMTIAAQLADRFSERGALGKVYVDPALANCPLPTQQRSASEGLFQVARGTHLPFGDESKDTLRFFVYWVGRDIDLSATLHDSNFQMIQQISYTNLRSCPYQACHSGDVVHAPNGASEFIDITIDGALRAGARYVAMNLYVFNGPNFEDHDRCFAGWMTRSKPKSNEIFDPKTVAQRVDITASSRGAIPVVFDLEKREAIWVDVAFKGRTYNLFGPITYGNFPIGVNRQGNNVESNRAKIEEILEAIVSLDNKVSLEELFRLHGLGRGTLVETREEADTVFAMDAGVTPYDVAKINSEYL